MLTNFKTIFYVVTFRGNISLRLNFPLDLSFNTYLGLFLIIIGLIVRIDFKFIMQKDLQ